MLVSPTGTLANSYAQGPESSLDWSIETSKQMFYPGEPVSLTILIANSGQQEEKIDFGADGIEAFSVEIRDNHNKVITKGGKIQRFGLGRLGKIPVPSGKIGQKLIVLNQWCSSLLPPAKYHVMCNVEYRLQSEATRIPGTEKGFKAGTLHRIQLHLDIELIKPDPSKYKEILDNLARYDVKREAQSFTDWRRDRDIAREMIAFTEWEFAVPYQLCVLKDAKRTWLKRDIINSLVRSKTLEAAIGLMEIVEDASLYKEDVKRQLIDAVYKLRETGKPEIIKATHNFVSEYKRPVLGKRID